MSALQTVILAGGKGTRIEPLSRFVPKNLVPVGGQPFARYQLGWLQKQGVTDVVYCIGHLGDQIRDFVGTGEQWGMRVTYAVEDSTALLGTAGALRNADQKGLLAPSFLV